MYHKMLRTTGEGLKDEDHDNEDSETYRNKLGMVFIKELPQCADNGFDLRNDSVIFPMVGQASWMVV